MITTQRQENIELTPFTINNGPSVNPWPMDDVQVQLVNGELMVHMRGHVGPNGELPGALVGFGLTAVKQTYGGLNYEMKIDECSSALLECFEGDLKWCVGPPNTPNIVDGSAQKVYSKGGMWQIDDSKPAWVDTGFKPGPFAVNQWNKVAIRQSVNLPKNQFSFTSITDGATASISSALRPLPLLTTDWDKTGIQFQLCLGKTGFAVVWLRNISAIFSDAIIP